MKFNIKEWQDKHLNEISRDAYGRFNGLISTSADKTLKKSVEEITQHLWDDGADIYDIEEFIRAKVSKILNSYRPR